MTSDRPVRDRDRQAPGSRSAALTASAVPPRLVPARVDLGDYRRRRFEAAEARLRWRYEHGLST